jgi:hypothetical protein
MSNFPDAPITGPMVWRGEQFRGDDSWVHRLNADDIAELDAALAAVRGAGRPKMGFAPADFPLGRLAEKLNAILAEVQDGRGFALLRGLPVERYARDEIETVYWGIGSYLGTVISQNAMGDLIAEVTDKGSDYTHGVNDRGYMSNDKLNPHVDTSDMTALLCLRTAGTGGVSWLSSSAAIFNELRATRPDLLAIYDRGFHHDLRGEGPTGRMDEVTHNRIPVFSYHAGLLSCCYNDKIMRSAHAKMGDSLSPAESEAIDLLKSVAERPDMRFEFNMAPGDIQLINNYVLLHARSEFRSDPDPAKRRCLLRMWMNCREPRPLAADFSERYNTGPRGGVFVRAKAS